MKKIVFLGLFLRIIHEDLWNLCEQIGQLTTPTAEHHHNHEDHHLAHGLNHSHPAHEDHQLVHEDHEHPQHKVPIPDTDLPLAARDYRVWLAATGKVSSKSEFKPIS